MNSPNLKDLQPIPKDLVKVGFPITHPLYDVYGKLLLQVGMIIESESQLEKLYERARYQDIKGRNAQPTDIIKGKGGVGSGERKVNQPLHQGEELVDLPFNKFRLGESLQITPLAENSGASKYFIKFIGGVDKKSLICTLPLMDDKVVFLKESSGFSVAMFTGKGVYRFNTMVDNVFSRPYPHMHLKFPREVYLKSLRKNQRLAVSVIVSMLNKTAGEYENAKFAGRIVDLSLGGILVETNKISASMNDILECSFKINIDGEELLFVIDGSLKSLSSTEQPDGRTINKYGLEFKGMLLQNKLILQNYIFQLLTGEKLDEL